MTGDMILRRFRPTARQYFVFNVGDIKMLNERARAASFVANFESEQVQR